MMSDTAVFVRFNFFTLGTSRVKIPTKMSSTPQGIEIRIFINKSARSAWGTPAPNLPACRQEIL